MKHTLSLAVILAAFSSSAIAAEPATPEAPKGEMMEKKMHDGHGHHKGEYMEKKMERMWGEMDANNDGTISKEESNAFNAKKFEERDANKDGNVTKEEWNAFYENRKKEKMEKMEKKHGDMKHGDHAKPEAPAEKK